MDISRRHLLGGLAAGAALSAFFRAPKALAAEGGSAVKVHKNEEFYGTDGKFNAETAKNAYYEMMKRFNYPIVDRLRTADFWTLDFGLGKFTEVGMAGIFWVNNQKDNYFGHEIYLLPGQIIPEHKHVKTDAAGPKLEGWHVRYGMIYTYGEGTPTPGVEDRIPPSHKECAKARTENKILPGEVGLLNGAEQWHWMKAGPEGAIVTEYATYHDGTGLRFSHPQVKM
jgi:D-lyxose ketol-isomerase